VRAYQALTPLPTNGRGVFQIGRSLNSVVAIKGNYSEDEIISVANQLLPE